MSPFLDGVAPGDAPLPWPDSAESWRELLDDLPVGVVVLDEDARVIAYNRAEAELAGTRPEDVVGRGCTVSAGPPDP